MKKSLFLFFIFTISGFIFSIQAKNPYKQIESIDSVSFFYKWKPSVFAKKDSPLMLLLKIKNENEHSVNVIFTVDYFWQAKRQASSDEKQICIKPMKSKKGKIGKLGFDTGSLTNEQILSDDFIVEITGINIEKTDYCIKDKSK